MTRLKYECTARTIFSNVDVTMKKVWRIVTLIGEKLKLKDTKLMEEHRDLLFNPINSQLETNFMDGIGDFSWQTKRISKLQTRHSRKVRENSN